MSQPQLIDAIYHGAADSFDALTHNLDRATLPLSGGYDSRYLAALATRRDAGR